MSLTGMKELYDALPKRWRIALLLGAGAAALLSSGIVASVLKKSKSRAKLLGKRQRKRQKCRDALEDLAMQLRSDKKISEYKDVITSLTLPQLVSELRQKNISAVQALRAYQAKALEAHELTNCLVEPIQEAEQWAEDLDKTAPHGALYGVPVSIKEYFSIKGYDSSLGIIGWIEKPAEDDSVLVKVLKKQGAVPFVKTNLPHMGFSYTTMNPIFGNTCNPRDTTRGPGGSSGGESALITANGSPLGFGSDVGGSIRNPAHFCGIAGLKPTGNRISSKGIYTVEFLSNCMPIVLGPLGPDVDSLVLVMRALLTDTMFELDRSVAPIPFRDEIYTDSRKLRIGFYTYDHIMRATPDCERAVMVAKQILEQKGHTVVPWQFPEDLVRPTADLAIDGKLFFADKGEIMLEVMEGDDAHVNIKDALDLANMPLWMRRLLAFFLRFVDKHMAHAVGFSLGAGSVAAWWKIVEEVQEIRKRLQESWDSAGIDAVVCPAFCCPAMPLGKLLFQQGEGSYVQLYNVIDVPAGVVPVTKVTQADVNNMTDYPTSNDLYRNIKDWMPGAVGLPVGVQVVTARWQEELCLRVMKEIEDGNTTG